MSTFPDPERTIEALAEINNGLLEDLDISEARANTFAWATAVLAVALAIIGTLYVRARADARADRLPAMEARP